MSDKLLQTWDLYLKKWYFTQKLWGAPKHTNCIQTKCVRHIDPDTLSKKVNKLCAWRTKLKLCDIFDLKNVFCSDGQKVNRK